ncbi:right-handed parallel beta-helix repeat-containing protein [Clostridium sp. CX1]|uniref:right-handed parallel beta-helix repeat-containing protein n=1 Tax=Clostridium sp. CX1 TaxID=2978346 RepID=UPI0021BE46E3|nr:right-handed parallel beta-helix repeat-containing protein [Clostridium sp. CX1]MCT8977444.1 right-handed parallel beta-helix repeat-containing protein [Clostridium sp. CX1]
MDFQAFNFSNHPLQRTDEHTQTLYLKFLLSIARVEDNKIFYDKMVDLLSVMMEEMDINLSLMTISKSVLSIDNNALRDFSETIKISNIEQNFLVDALMFSIILEGSSNKTLKYIVDIASVLGINQQQIKELMQLSKIVLEQDKTAFKDMCYEVLNINVSKFMMYTKSFTDLYVINDMDIYSDVKYEYDNVVFANMNLIGQPICDTITDIKKLLIINCNLSNSSSEYTIFDCGKVIIKNCIFGNFSDTALHIYDCEELDILNCEFSNCIQNVDNGYCFDSATMLLDDIENIKISGCTFNNCHSVPQLSLMGMVLNPSSAIATLENVKYFRLRDSKFIDCISNRKFSEKGVLFVLNNTECGKATSCIRTNSCDVGDERLGKW